MPANETTPLLGNGHPNHEEPTWIASFNQFFFGSWFNIFLIFVPLSTIAHYANFDAAFRFSFSFLAIIPLAKLLGDATEQISLKLGQTQAGLLNASFGNAVEIIVGVAALLQGELRIVQTSMLGSILSNILLVLGCSFVAAGINFKQSSFQAVAAQVSSSLMTLSCITLVIPAAYHGTHKTRGAEGKSKIAVLIDQWVDLDEEAERGLMVISRGTAIVLLIVYVLYLYFQLGSHADLFQGEPEEEQERAKMNPKAAAVGLLGTTVVTAFCADFLVASIEEVATRYKIPKAFIGLILLPIVANAAEHVTAVWMAMKDRMELTITICVGSSIQIAAFVVPLLVIVGWMVGKPLSLFFADFETVTLFVSVFLVNTLIQDGKSNYMEGVMLLALYFVIGLAFWVQ